MSAADRLPILVVEDDEPTLRLLKALLHRSGYPCETLSGGRDAIAQLKEKQYAAVILDIMMPEVGGHEVIKFLAQDGNRTPVVVCSAAGPAALANLDPTVVKAIVLKPFDVEQFVATLGRVTAQA